MHWVPAFASRSARALRGAGPWWVGGFPHVPGCLVRAGRSDAPHDRSGRVGAVPSFPELSTPFEQGRPHPGPGVRGRVTFAAPYHSDPSGLPVGYSSGVPRLECREAAGLAEPLALRPVATRSPLRPGRTEREGQAVPQRSDPGRQVLYVRRLAAACERPLIMRGLRDRTRDPRRRQCRQVPLTCRPGVRTVLETIRTTGLEITGRQRPLMRTDRTQHQLALGGQVLKTVPDRHPTRPRRHEGRRQFP